MRKKLLAFIGLGVLFFGTVSSISGLEKVKFGTSVKMIFVYYLPPLTAEEKGFWKENGLEVEWVPFASATVQFRGVAAGEINIGLCTMVDSIMAAERGVPVITVAEAYATFPWSIWVRTDSPYRHPRELKGARVGVNMLGSVTHTLGRIVAAALGIEKEVRFVGAGGVPEMMAGLKVGAYDAALAALAAGVALKTKGEIRELVSVDDYLPRPWTEGAVFARKDFARSKPEVVRKMLRAILQSLAFIRENPRYAIDKAKSFQVLPEEAAKELYERIRFTVTGKLDRRAIENMRKTFIKYGVISEKAPSVDEIFTNEYLP